MAENFTYENGFNGGSGGGSSSPVSPTPISRNITFEIKSDPLGAAIFVNGSNTGYTTPHTLNYTEAELLSPKTVNLVNANNSSVETYVLSSQVITTTTGGGSYGGGYSGGGGGNNGNYQ